MKKNIESYNLLISEKRLIDNVINDITKSICLRCKDLNDQERNMAKYSLLDYLKGIINSKLK